MSPENRRQPCRMLTPPVPTQIAGAGENKEEESIEMSQELIVVAFKNRFKAIEVLQKLKRMNRDWTIGLDHAVAVYRGRNGELRLDQNYDLSTGEGAGWGALWGSVVGAIIGISTVGLAAPVVAASAVATGLIGGGSVGAATGAIAANVSDARRSLSEDFVRRVAKQLTSGDSAIFAVLEANYPDEVVSQFEGFGGKVLKTTLSREETSWIESVLNRGASNAEV